MTNHQETAHRYTCEQCELKEASFYCYRCAEDDDPFLYCEDCMNVAHHGRKRCYHQEEPIAEYEKMMAKVNSTVINVQRNMEQHDNFLQEEKASIITSANEAEVRIHSIFDELKDLLDIQQKEVIARISHIKEERLSLFSKKETACSEIKNMVEESIQSANDNAEFILSSTKPHLLDDALAKITKKLEERSTLIDRFFTVSSFPRFVGVFGIIPSITRLRENIQRYTIPYLPEWGQDDTINNCIVYNSKTIVVKSNHFWVGERMTEDRYATLCHISDTLRDLMPNSPEPPTDLSPDTLVCAYYERESSWHRGIVEKITEKRGKKMVAVRFLDYGNSEEICIDLVSKLPIEFTEYPFQCRLCHFSNDVTFTDREIKWKLMDYVKGRELTVKIMKRTYICGSIVPEFSVEMYTDQNQNIGASLCQYILEKSQNSQEDFPIKYKDVRNRGNTRSKSPVSSTGIVASPNDNSTIPSEKETSDTEHTITDKIISEKKQSSDTEGSPGHDVKLVNGKEELDTATTTATKEEDKEIAAGTGKNGIVDHDELMEEECNGGTVVGQETKEETINECEQYQTDNSESTITGGVESVKEGDSNIPSTDEDKLHEVTVEKDSVEIAVEKSAEFLPSSLNNSESITDNALVLQDVCSPCSQVRPVSSRTSSVCPISSPSQGITQSQSDTHHSFSPSSHSSCDIDIDIPATNSTIVDIIPPSPPLSPASADLHHLSDTMVATSPVRNLMLDLTSISVSDKEQEEMESNSVIVSVDYVPPRHPIIFKGANLTLLVNSSLSPEEGIFWAELVLNEEEQHLYTKLSDELQRYSATKGLYTPMFFEPGDFCMAVYSEDEQWYRGRIEEHSDDKHLLVRFMDFGNSELVEIPNIMTLKNEFRQLPFQAIKCSIAHEDKVSFTSEECEKFAVCLANNSVSAVVTSFEDDIVYINVKLSDTNEDLFAKIVTVKSRCYSFELDPFENTNISTWADRMEDNDDVFTDTELTRQRQRRTKSELNMKEPLSENEMSTPSHKKDKKKIINQTAHLNSKTLSHSSSSASPVNCLSSHSRLSVDKTVVTKFLKFDSVSPKNGEPAGSGDLCSSVSKTKEDERVSLSEPPDVIEGNKGKFGKKGKKGKSQTKKMGSLDKETIRGGSSSKKYTSFTDSSRFGGSKGFKRNTDLPDHMTTIRISGLSDVPYSQVQEMFRQYGRTANKPRSRRQYNDIMYFLDIERTAAVRAKDGMHGTRPKGSLRSLEIVIATD